MFELKVASLHIFIYYMCVLKGLQPAACLLFRCGRAKEEEEEAGGAR